jgi:hypothetical protein
MQSAVGVLGVNGSTACFADLRREIIPLIGLKARLLAQKGLLQSLVVAAVWGFTKARQMA